MDPTFRSADIDLPVPGQVIAGKYRVDGVIGSGGMGVVLGATDTSLGRPVAIKFLSPHKARREGAVARFLREARAAASIQSEHVVRVFEVGTAPNGAPYIVMEQLRGNDLSQELQLRGPLPIPVAVDHLLQACEALGEAHGRGIVHRDLKPQNLFVSPRPDGSPCLKILDFGISKAVDEGAPNLTSTDQVMGTPLYMSPEQVRSLKNVDQRSDIWALGSILYELVTGRPIYEAPSASALCAMIAMDPPIPLRARLPTAPPELEGVILRCLHKDPGGRFQDVAQLAEALVPFATDRGRASAGRVSRVVRSGSSSAGGVIAVTPGAAGIPHLGAPGAPGSNSTVDALGRPSAVPQQLFGMAPPAWGPPSPQPTPPAYGSMVPPHGSVPPAHAGSAMPPMMSAPPPPGTQSTWQHTNTGNLTNTGERRGMSAPVVALLGVLTGVALLALVVGGAVLLLKPNETAQAADAGAALGAAAPEAGSVVAIADAGSPLAVTTGGAAGKPGIMVPPGAKRDAGAPAPQAAAKDAGAPPVKPSGPTAAEELEARRRAAEGRCDHQRFLLSQNKAPDNMWAKNVKNQTCWQDPDRPSCERTNCIRACQILDDKMCIDMMERHNKTFPPPF